MPRAYIFSMLLTLLGCSFLVAQEEEKFLSGPQKGAFLPAPFECYNINGPAKGRLQCLVCKFELKPAVMIFAKEPAEGKDEELNNLLKQLDDAVEEFEDRAFSVGVIFLSPDARDSTNNAQEEKPEEIVKETVKREALVNRLKPCAEKLKHVIVACYLSEGPKAYKLNAKADITILFYERLKVIENYAYPPEKMEAKDVEMIVKRVREELPRKKKSAVQKQRNG